MQGEVVGVNTAIYSPSGGSVGIGFAIPAPSVKNVIAQLKDKGTVSRGWIGVQIQPVTPDIADSMGLKQAEGALVADPQKDGPAAKAGVESGDIITAVNGQSIKDFQGTRPCHRRLRARQRYQAGCPAQGQEPGRHADPRRVAQCAGSQG